MTGFLASPQEVDRVSSHITCLAEGTRRCLWDTCPRLGSRAAKELPGKGGRPSAAGPPCQAPAPARAIEKADCGIGDLGNRRQAWSLTAPVCQRHPSLIPSPSFASLSNTPHSKKRVKKKRNKITATKPSALPDNLKCKQQKPILTFLPAL